MSTEHGNYRLITAHAPFPTIAPNQKPLSNFFSEALSHWSEMKIHEDVLHWVLPKITVPTSVTRCAFIALRKFYSDCCLKPFCEFPNNISPKTTNPHSLQQSSQYCGSIVQRTNCKVAFWFGAIARKVACTVISRSFARSVDIVAGPAQRRFAFCTSWKVSEVIQRSRRNNK